MAKANELEYYRFIWFKFLKFNLVNQRVRILDCAKFKFTVHESVLDFCFVGLTPFFEYESNACHYTTAKDLMRGLDTTIYPHCFWLGNLSTFAAFARPTDRDITNVIDSFYQVTKLERIVKKKITNGEFKELL